MIRRHLITTVTKISLTATLFSFPIWSINEIDHVALKNQSQQNTQLKQQAEQRDHNADSTENMRTDSSTIIDDQDENNTTPILDDEDESQEENTTATRAKNRRYDNVLVNNYLDARILRIDENAYIGGDLSVTHNANFGSDLSVTRNISLGGNLTVQGDTILEGGTTIAGDITITGAVTTVGDFNVTGTLTAQNAVITDNITINTITKNGNTVAWPSTVGAPGTVLSLTAPNTLGYITPAGGGNVSTASNFTTNNRLVTTDTPSSVTNIKESAVTLDGSNNITGINALTATTLNGTLNGNVGTKTTAAVVNATQAVENATNTLTPNTLVLRDASNNFFAGTITANLTGNVLGDLTGNADTATFATNAGGFTGSLSGDVTGNQSTTQVISIGNGAMTSATIITGVNLANNATNLNTANRIVRRDGSGNFSGATITAVTGFSGNLAGDVTGDVTGSLFGNATSATMSDTAQWFTVPLAGDVTGPQLATVVIAVGNKSTAQVVQSVDDTIAATPNNVAGTLVKRDGSSHFSVNSITIVNPPSADSDATNKEYVDSVAQGLSPKTPVLATSIINTSTATLATPIDGVTLSANDRVLLTQQNYQINNGIWLAQSTDWTRPTDFAIGSTAGQAFVLTTSGLTLAGSGWLCNTPLAIVGTNTVTFVQFSNSGNTTAANVGTGVGEIFRDKIGLTLNFKTLAAATVIPAATGNFVTITNGANELTLAVTATSDNTANTLVSRDALGNFSAGTITASLTGNASGNVLKTGDTMTGNLIIASTAGTRHEIDWQDSTGANIVGLRAPATLGASYTVALPENAPIAGQFLRALTSLTTTWTTVDAPPSATMTFYVAKNGNDANDGSFSAPLLTVKKALSRANNVASNNNKVAIQIGAGTFDEDNSGGTTLKVLADGISIVGVSLEGTIIRPLAATDDLFTVTVANVEFSDFSMHAKPAVTSTASALNFSSDFLGHSRFTNLHFSAFQTGVAASSTTGLPVVQLLNCNYTENEMAISLTNVQVLAQNSLFRGSFTTPANTGIHAQGSLAHISVLDCTFTAFNTALLTDGGATQHLVASTIKSTLNSIVCTGSSKSEIVGMNFTLNDETSINITATVLGTKVYMEGCLFNCEDALNNRAGTAIQVVNGAEVIANACTIDEALLGIQCGTSGDTATTKMQASNITFIETSTCIKQNGASTLQLVGCSLDITKMIINNPTNIDFAGYNTTNNNVHLAIGQAADISNTIYQILNTTSPATLPYLSYEPNYYGAQGTVYKNPQGSPTFNGTQALGNDAFSYVVTSSRDKETTLKLISDTANIGIGDNVRGWAITKRGNQADLVFTFTNNDSSGLAVRGPYNIMQLNGDENKVEFPVATGTSPTFTTAHLVWGDDTALYRSADATLTIDNNLVISNNLTVNGLTASRAVATDANKKLVSSATTSTDLGFLAGVTSAIQPQIDSKVFRAGDTMTGTFTVVAGTAASPSLQFVGSTNTGFSAATANRLSFDTLGVERMSINATGTVTINQLSGTAGVVHNYADGALSSSLIVNADVDPAAAIVDTKLATISTAGKVANSATTAASINTASAIVARDVLGTFTATGITATNFYGNLTGNAATATSAITSTSSTFFTGSLFGDVTGLQSTTSVAAVGGKTATAVAAAVTDVQLSTTVNTPNTLVRRGTTGDFAAGMITASLTGMVIGTASFNVLKIGDTMTGSLTLPPGTAAAPSLRFTGGTTTGLSMPSTNLLSFDTNGIERMSIDSTGTVSILGTLVLAAGTAAQPSLKFTNGTNTGFSSATANKISFNANGVQKMTIDATTVTATTTFISAAACILAKEVCLGGIQTDATNGTSVTVANSTSILLKIPSATVAAYAITMPTSPIHGQLLTIIDGTAAVQVNGITYVGGTVVNGVDQLRPATNMSATSNGQSITFVFNSGTTTWYRYNRG